MGPTGTLTTVLAVLGAIVAPVLLLRFGSGSERPAPAGARGAGPVHGRGRHVRARRRPASRVPTWATRLGLLMTCQVSCVVVVAVVANDLGQFYSNWSDLLGDGAAAEAGNVTAHYGAPAARTATTAAPVPKPVAVPRVVAGAPNVPAAAAGWHFTSWSSRSEWTQRGAVVSTTVKGSASGLSEPALVYLPPAYFRTGSAARSMPLVEVLTGFPGTVSHLVSRLRYPDRTLAGIQAGSVSDMVLVMLTPAPTFPWDTECTNVPGGPQALQFFTTDVPSAVTQQFGLQVTHYATMGDSTGGYCAAKIAMSDPARFGAAVTLSGYYSPATDLTTRGMFDNNPALRQNNDLVWLLNHRPAPRMSLLVASARDEAGSDGYGTSERLLAAVHAPMSADALVLPHGGHNFTTWGREIPYALIWLSAHLGGSGKSD